MRPTLAFDTSTPCARVALLSPAGDCLATAEKVAARHSSNLLRLCDQVLQATGTTVAELAAIACGAGPGSFTGLRVGLAVAKGLALADRIPLVLVSSLDALAMDLAGSGCESLVPILGDSWLVPVAGSGAGIEAGSGSESGTGRRIRLRRPAPATGSAAANPAAQPTTNLGEAVLVLPCIDAGKGQVYGRLYRAAGGAPAPISTDDFALVPEDLCRLVQAQAAGAAVAAGGNGVDRYLEVFRAQLGSEAVRFQVAGPSALAVGRLALARLARGERDDLETSVPRYGRLPDITKPKSAP